MSETWGEAAQQTGRVAIGINCVFHVLEVIFQSISEPWDGWRSASLGLARPLELHAARAGRPLTSARRNSLSVHPEAVGW